jgi:hypothetical protein
MFKSPSDTEQSFEKCAELGGWHRLIGGGILARAESG